MNDRVSIRKWLLACGVIMLLTGVLHTFGSLHEPTPETPEQAELFRMMKQVKLGLPTAADRTMSELTQGFSLLMSVLCFAAGGAAIATAIRVRNGPGAGVLTWVVVASLVMATAISQVFFFAIPTACFGLALLLGVLSLLLDGRARRAGHVM